MDEVGGREDGRPRRKQLRKKRLVQIRIEISAAVLDDCDAKIGVARLKKSGQDNSTGSDTEQNKSADVVGAKNHREVGTGKSADTVLSDDDFVFCGSKRRVNVAQRFLKQALMLRRSLDRSKELIPCSHLRKTSPKTNFNMEDRHVRCACVIQNAGSTRNKPILITLGIDGHDTGLAIHT